MKSLLLIISLCFFGPSAFAEGGMYIGANSTSFSSSTDGISYSGAAGFEAGYTKIVDFNYDVFLRTGVGIAQRHARYESGTSKFEVDFIMLEIPATALYDFGDVVAGFAGFNFNYAASVTSKLNGNSIDIDDTAEDIVFTFVAGFNFAVTVNHLFEVYFETTMTEAFPNNDYSVMAARYVYMFD